MVITDIKMPGMDGVTVLGEIKKINPEIEVIIMTGYGTIENVVNSLRFGVFDFINKPFSFQALGKKVRQVLDSHSVSSR